MEYQHVVPVWQAGWRHYHQPRPVFQNAVCPAGQQFRQTLWLWPDGWDVDQGQDQYSGQYFLARWRITDPMRYYLRLKDEHSAQSRLEDILRSETRTAIARHELIEVVPTNKDRQPLKGWTTIQFMKKALFTALIYICLLVPEFLVRIKNSCGKKYCC